MQQPIIQLPGYKVNEYLLILNPHQELSNKIVELKNEFNEKNKRAGYVTKPNISIVKFTQYELYESRIKDNLHRLAMEMKPFKVELKDYGSFPTHTIFINVTSKIPFQTLAKKVRTDAQKLMKFDDEHKPHFFMEPYIPIAQKIPQQLYDKAWLEYSHRHFTGRFIADDMLLLKRPVGELRYQIVDRFVFENLAVGVSQGQLF
ncbi:MAG: 2'-5' RNA ligase family protein [Chitinophagaceae bacterium]|nr:MAG: 2'-5' RNA ligase family protein [Chitinophagaceae bacterium]